ncbi:MAG: hypothetical protein ACXWDP_04750 [Solirubrobacterales bacterium]
MSDRDQEIISSLRRAYEAFNHGDFDAAIEVAHPEIEFVRPGSQSLDDDGLATRVEGFLPQQEIEAFEAAGLRE